MTFLVLHWYTVLQKHVCRRLHQLFGEKKLKYHVKKKKVLNKKPITFKTSALSVCAQQSFLFGKGLTAYQRIDSSFFLPTWITPFKFSNYMLSSHRILIDSLRVTSLACSTFHAMLCFPPNSPLLLDLVCFPGNPMPQWAPEAGEIQVSLWQTVQVLWPIRRLKLEPLATYLEEIL